jgi:hypothetical protein
MAERPEHVIFLSIFSFALVEGIKIHGVVSLGIFNFVRSKFIKIGIKRVEFLIIFWFMLPRIVEQTVSSFGLLNILLLDVFLLIESV